MINPLLIFLIIAIICLAIFGAFFSFSKKKSDKKEQKCDLEAQKASKREIIRKPVTVRKPQPQINTEEEELNQTAILNPTVVSSAMVSNVGSMENESGKVEPGSHHHSSVAVKEIKEEKPIAHKIPAHENSRNTDLEAQRERDLEAQKASKREIIRKPVTVRKPQPQINTEEEELNQTAILNPTVVSSAMVSNVGSMENESGKVEPGSHHHSSVAVKEIKEEMYIAHKIPAHEIPIVKTAQNKFRRNNYAKAEFSIIPHQYLPEERDYEQYPLHKWEHYASMEGIVLGSHIASQGRLKDKVDSWLMHGITSFQTWHRLKHPELYTIEAKQKYQERKNNGEILWCRIDGCYCKPNTLHQMSYVAVHPSDSGEDILNNLYNGQKGQGPAVIMALPDNIDLYCDHGTRYDSNVLGDHRKKIPMSDRHEYKILEHISTETIQTDRIVAFPIISKALKEPTLKVSYGDNNQYTGVAQVNDPILTYRGDIISQYIQAHLGQYCFFPIGTEKNVLFRDPDWHNKKLRGKLYIHLMVEKSFVHNNPAAQKEITDFLNKWEDMDELLEAAQKWKEECQAKTTKIDAERADAALGSQKSTAEVQ